MKREIKFRFWDTHSKVMCICESEAWEDYLSKFFIDFDSAKESNNNPILMQYTGLKDKNGVEIYEGDIVTSDNWTIMQDKHGNYIKDASGQYRSVCEVVEMDWMEIDAFEVYGWNIWGFYGSPLGQRIQSEIKVIGNIHQHPELL